MLHDVVPSSFPPYTCGVNGENEAGIWAEMYVTRTAVYSKYWTTIVGDHATFASVCADIENIVF